MASQPIEDAVQLLRTEYLEWPDLVLTPSQVAALLDLDGVTAAAVLRVLEDSRFLERTPSGRFIQSHNHDFNVAVNHRGWDL